ncbi:MAG: hypothetical protein WCL36_01350 [bacterium]
MPIGIVTLSRSRFSAGAALDFVGTLAGRAGATLSAGVTAGGGDTAGG